MNRVRVYYHHHTANEEAMYVFSGTGTIRSCPREFVAAAIDGQ